MKIPTPNEIRKMITTWEKRTVDFKAKEAIPNPAIMSREVVERKDLELAKDIASFANTLGGYLIVGVEEKSRNIQDYAISDRLKTRVSSVLRKKIDPIAVYEIENVKVGRRQVTVFAIQEGEGDLCTVDGRIHVRDVNGRAVATGAEITRLVKKRLGRKISPTPTKRELINSPYNLPTEEERRKAMNKDFVKAAQSLRFKNIMYVPRTEQRIRFASTGEAGHTWQFFVMPIVHNFGLADFRATTIMASHFNTDSGLRKRINNLVRNDFINVLALVLGRVNSLNSVLQYSGLSYVPTAFGGYVGPGSSAHTPPKSGLVYHIFFLSGVTNAQLMKKRLQDFLTWLDMNKDWLVPRKRPSLKPVILDDC